MATIKIFLIGATGYVGGTVLRDLLAHPQASTFSISALLRSESKARVLTSAGVTPVLGSLDDLDKLEAQALQSDIVFSTASSDLLPPMQALLRGLKARFDKTRIAPILIHTSGAAVLGDSANGEYASPTIYHDTDLAQLDSISPTALHRNVDLEILRADAEGYVRTYIIALGLIWGLASGPFVDAGFQKQQTFLIAELIKVGIGRGRVGMVGPGKNIWPISEINEAAEVYTILLDAILAGSKDAGHGREGVYFVENGEYTTADACVALGECLFAAGKVSNAEPRPFNTEEMTAYPLLALFGTNLRCRAERIRSLGWKPKKGVVDFMESLEAEVAFTSSELGDSPRVEKAPGST